MSLLNRLYLFVGVALVAACFTSVIKHNQHLAAKTAEEFSQLAFVQRQYDDASRFTRSGRSDDEVGKMAERLHPSGKYPITVAAMFYEPMPGKESVKIYLEGSGGDPTYRYVAIMEGTEPKGYRVSAITRSEAPFPVSNNIKPLR